MSRILVTGIATLDIINFVGHYPVEDEELRADAQQLRRGGNAANTSYLLAQLSHDVQLLSTLADDMPGRFIRNSLHEDNIGFSDDLVIPKAATPTSYITLNRSSGSRTIVHYRDLEELTFDQFKQDFSNDYDWCHFEGRNIEQVSKMMNRARQSGARISLEAEKPRDHIEQLFPLADVIMFSRPFAQSQQFNSAQHCLEHFAGLYPHAILSCTWGEDGAYAIVNKKLIHSPAYKPTQVIDTIGAGDTFNAGFIHSLLSDSNVSTALTFACKLAGKKCGQSGFDNLGIFDD